MFHKDRPDVKRVQRESKLTRNYSERQNKAVIARTPAKAGGRGNPLRLLRFHSQ